MWTIKFRNGTMKRFKFPIRTTPEGSADPTGGFPDPDASKLADPDTLFDGNTHPYDKSQFAAG